MKKIIISVTAFIFILAACSKKDANPSPPAASPPDTTPSVKICNQIWMLKNLDVDKYSNGDPIPQVTDNAQWAALTTGAWCYLRNDAANGAIYGKLYNWHAVIDPRGLAPKGWHIPSTNEYSTLANCLGGGMVAGDKLKASGTTWGTYNNGATNSSGFTALPGGFRDGKAEGWNDGWFHNEMTEGRWWTKTSYDNEDSWFHNLYGSMSNSYIDYSNKGDGYSIRCVKN